MIELRWRGGVIGTLTAIVALLSPQRSAAQMRGVYPLGMSAMNSGLTPKPGFTYANQLLLYSRDQLRGPNGELLATGGQSVLMDMNTLTWVRGEQIPFLGGARYSASVTLPIAKNSLSSDVQGTLSGGSGFADSYYQPLILSWQLPRLDLRAIYGFLAPTGKFSATATDNVGSGYWTHTLAAGETLALTNDGATAVSTFEMYEFHTAQEGTGIHPGQTFNLDYSVTQTIPLDPGLKLQLGVVGYSQWQTTDKSGPTITAQQAAAHYRVYALGLGSSVLLPEHRVSAGLRFFDEFSNRSTFQGYSLQIAGAITF